MNNLLSLNQVRESFISSLLNKSKAGKAEAMEVVVGIRNRRIGT